MNCKLNLCPEKHFQWQKEKIKVLYGSRYGNLSKLQYKIDEK